ncbi:Altered inheritance rate of mitochondria protein 25 [Linum grandiflorum]
MNWTKGSHFFRRSGTSRRDVIYPIGASSNSSCLNALPKDQHGVLASSSPVDNSLARGVHCQRGLIFARSLFGRYAMLAEAAGACSGLNVKHGVESFSTRFQHSAANDSHLSRDFLAQLWVLDKKAEKFARNRTNKSAKHRRFSQSSQHDGTVVLEQPPPNLPLSGFLKPTSLEEAQVAPLLARSNLLITRDIEWANLVLGFEQENRYAVLDVCHPQAPVGFIREQSNMLARQFLRTRRPFVALITDAMGNELFRVRRPYWWITSSIYAEINGKEVGVVHRRWHLWRRIYDLYLGDKQFAIVENPGLWYWTFTLKDIEGKVVAQIDRNWRGFGFEILTDAGQYVIRFGSQETEHSSLIEELEVARPLSLTERAITVALAISLDNDYFSRHGGWGVPFSGMGE